MADTPTQAEMPAEAANLHAPELTGWRRAWQRPWCRAARLAAVVAGGWGLMRWADARTLHELAGQSRTAWEAVGRLAMYWATAAWVLLMLLSRRWWLRWPMAMLAAAAIATDQFYLHYVNREGFTPNDIFMALANPSTIGDSFRAYGRKAFPVLAACFVPAAVAALWLPRLTVRVPARIALAGAIVLAPLGVLMAREGYGPAGHAASPVRLPAFMAYFAAKAQGVPDRGRPILPAPKAGPLVDHVVLIVDESVMGSHLSVNGYVRNTSPLLAALIARGEARSLGLCSSACNFSVGSFLTILSGARFEQAYEGEDSNSKLLTLPSLVAYAAQAGYSVQFLNSQDYLIWVAGEKKQLGEAFRTVSADRDRLPAWQWDHSLLNGAVDFIKAHDRTFTLVAKRGIHYPYFDKCPPELRRFTPCLSEAVWSDRFIENLNSYDNAMAWTCDNYLASLRDALEKAGRNALILYTSDHGQILPREPIPGFEDGYDLDSTHAMADSPTTSVADVPLLLLATTPAKTLLAALPAANRDLASHFDIFPTVLWLMGYPQADMARPYGRHLWQPIDPARKREFREGKTIIPKWRPFSAPDNSRKFRAARQADGS